MQLEESCVKKEKKKGGRLVCVFFEESNKRWLTRWRGDFCSLVGVGEHLLVNRSLKWRNWTLAVLRTLNLVTEPSNYLIYSLGLIIRAVKDELALLCSHLWASSVPTKSFNSWITSVKSFIRNVKDDKMLCPFGLFNILRVQINDLRKRNPRVLIKFWGYKLLNWRNEIRTLIRRITDLLGWVSIILIEPEFLYKYQNNCDIT